MDEALLLALASQGGGGGGGTSSYSDLTNKPQINGVTLSGNKTSAELGITSAIETTYSALKALRDGGNLIPGTWYRITDFVTKINGKYDLSLVGAQGYLHYAKSAEHPFDLCVLAIAADKLDEHAVATLHSGDTYFANSDLESWDIKYTIDNDPTKYLWADATNGKGVIFFMRDEYGNEAGYDFKNAQILAYALAMDDPAKDADSLVYDASTQPNRYGSLFGIFTALTTYMQTGTYVSPYANSGHDFAVGANILGVITFPEVDATYLSAFQADWYYTFDYLNQNSLHEDFSITTGGVCAQNKIAPTLDAVFAQLGFSPAPFGMNASIFECNTMVSSDGFDSNELGFLSVANIFGGGTCRANRLASFCYGNIFGAACWNNTFKDFCDSNTFEYNCVRNTFGDGCSSNTFGRGCISNTFGNVCEQNTFGNGCSSNTFGDYCGNNTFGDGCDSNTFGYDCDSNTFGNVCEQNTFGDYDQSNKFGDYCKWIHITSGTALGSQVMNYEVKNSVAGTQATPYEPTVTERNTWVTCIGYNSQGNIVSWVPADQ